MSDAAVTMMQDVDTVHSQIMDMQHDTHMVGYDCLLLLDVDPTASHTAASSGVKSQPISMHAVLGPPVKSGSLNRPGKPVILLSKLAQHCAGCLSKAMHMWTCLQAHVQC